MIHEIHINSHIKFDLNKLITDLNLEYEYTSSQPSIDQPRKITHFLWHPQRSTTIFHLDCDEQGVTLSMDSLASYDDYLLFPYLADCISAQLRGHGVEGMFQQYNEDWVATAIGEAIALVKAYLVSGHRYYLQRPLHPYDFIDNETLAQVGVSFHSSTPRIYGYIQHLLRKKRLPNALEVGFEQTDHEGEEIEVDIPQHQSVGRVKSWQTDGAETWQSFAQTDVDMLLSLGKAFEREACEVDAVVLNDLGTLYQEGIGVNCDGTQAVLWWERAIAMGDNVFSPNNLGDLYRKGCAPIAVDLEKAFAAYTRGTDPYAHYRVGQAWEEGWTGKRDEALAQQWFERARQEGHHLALRKLHREE